MDKNRWMPVLKVMMGQNANRITLATSKTTRGQNMQIQGLLSAMQEIIHSDHKITNGVNITNGEIGEDALDNFCDYASNIKLEVKLDNIIVDLKKDHENNVVYARKLRAKLKQRIELLNESFRTTQGRLIIFDEDSNEISSPVADEDEDSNA